eukprot:3708805-Prymnesium_polylepis.1
MVNLTFHDTDAWRLRPVYSLSVHAKTDHGLPCSWHKGAHPVQAARCGEAAHRARQQNATRASGPAQRSS